MPLSPEQEALIRKRADEGKLTPDELAAWQRYEAQRQPIEPPAAEAPPVAPPAPTPAPAPTPPPPATPQRSLWERVKDAWNYDVTRLPSDIKALAVQAWEAIPESKGSADPRDTTPWYQRAKQQFLEGQYAVDPSFGTVSPLPSADKTPEQHTVQMQAQQDVYRQVNRQMLEWMPTIIAAVYSPAPVAAGAYTKLAALYREVGVPLIRAAWMYLGQVAAEEVANIVDPGRYIDPGKAAWSQAQGEFWGSIGGRVVDKTARSVGGVVSRAFEETPMGTGRREVIESLGEQPTPGMVSERYWPRSVDTIMQQQPQTGRVRDRYAQVHGRLQQELQRHSDLHPGTRVTAAGQVLQGEITGMSTPPILHSGPRVLRQARDEAIEQANRRMDQVYGDLDTNYLTRPLDWGRAKPNLPSLYGMQDLLLDPALLPQVGADSLFHEVLRLNQALLQHSDTITVAGAFDLLKRVHATANQAWDHLHEMDRLVKEGLRKASPLTESIQKKVLPALGEMGNQLNQLVRPYLTDISAAKAHAARLVGAHETPMPGVFRTSEATLQGGQAARFAVMEDPHLQVARDLLLQPNFVSFTEAHQIRAKLLKVARQEGPLIDNTIAEQGQKMADLVDTAMTQTASGLTPDLSRPWRMANDIYRETKEMFENRLMHEFKDMNLDDILTTLIKRERPNDMLLLREVLGKTPAGQDVFDTASQMWLTRQIEEARRRGAGRGGMDTAWLRTQVDGVDAASERILFPRGELAALKGRLYRTELMERAVDEVGKGGKADALVLDGYKRALQAHPDEWAAVQSDALHHMLTERGAALGPAGATPRMQGLVAPHQFLDHLIGLKEAGRVLFAPAHYDELVRLGHTAAYVQRAADRSQAHWNPLIRFGEHTMGPLGGGLATAGAHLLLHNPVVTGAVAGSWLIGTQGLAYLLTNPTAVRALTQGLTLPVNGARAGEIVGLILAQLNNGGYEKELTPVGAPAPAPAGP